MGSWNSWNWTLGKKLVEQLQAAGTPWQCSPCPRDTQPCPCQARSSFAGGREEPSPPADEEEIAKRKFLFLLLALKPLA